MQFSPSVRRRSRRAANSSAPAVTEADRTAFHDAGYIALPGPFASPEELRALARLVDRQFDRFHNLSEEIAMDLGGPRGPYGSLVRVPDIDHIMSLDRAFFRDPAVAAFWAVAEELYGGPLQLTFNHAIYKPAGKSGDVPWHQDSGYDPSGRDTLTVWIPLQDTDTTNGCLRYVPGSHHTGAKAHVDLEGRHGKVLVDPVDEEQVIYVPVPAGGVLIHRRHSVHGSGPNDADLPRRTLILNLTSPVGLRQTARMALGHAHIKRLSLEGYFAARKNKDRGSASALR